MAQARFNGVFDGDRAKWADFRFLFVEWVRTFQTPEYPLLDFLEKDYAQMWAEVDHRIPDIASGQAGSTARKKLRNKVLGYSMEEDRRELMRVLMNSLRGVSAPPGRSIRHLEQTLAGLRWIRPHVRVGRLQQPHAV